MASIYDKYNTPKEIVEEVEYHGLSTKQEDICRVQDIFGRAPISTLVELSNGMRSEKFYMILFHIWNWKEATDFYNQYSNPKFAELKCNSELYEQCNKSLKEKVSENERLERAVNEKQSARIKAEEKVGLAELKIAELEQQIIELKAKLYDVLIENKEEK